MKAVNFFKNNQSVVSNPLYKKILNKEEKMHQRNNRYKIDHLSEEEQKHALYLLTLAGHYLEGFIDCLDELDNYSILGKKHNLNLVKGDLLIAQKFFIMEALKEGEDVSLYRQQQQVVIEKFMQKITTLDLKKLYELLKFTEEL